MGPGDYNAWQERMPTFDLDAYVARSGALDLDAIAWDEVPRHPLPPQAVRTLRYMQDIESHTIIYLRSGTEEAQLLAGLHAAAHGRPEAVHEETRHPGHRRPLEANLRLALVHVHGAEIGPRLGHGGRRRLTSERPLAPGLLIVSTERHFFFLRSSKSDSTG